ncbi:MAG TPA: long-chain fatty acid--CoA ligase [Holophagaceae bacterium]|nr:long-chain fatty acid--CoA ligase [Holophagaceae bacterium]
MPAFPPLPECYVAQPPVDTIAKLFYAALEHELPDAMAMKVDGAYQPIPQAEILAKVERLALAMHARGLVAGDRVAILSENRPEWAMTDYACAISGLPLVTIYATLIPAQAAFILKDSGARWVFCSTPAQLAKVIEEWPDLPSLEAAVLIQGQAPAAPGRTILTWAQLQGEGEAMESRRREVRAWADARTPDDLLTLIYTSGTTADPKGAVLTHGNVTSNVHGSLQAMPVRPGDRCLSFLPLTHIFERMAGHYVMWHVGAGIYYAESVNTVATNMNEVRPTVLCSVPRIYEKIYARIIESMDAAPAPKRAIFRWAMGIGAKVAPLRYENKEPSGWLAVQQALADRLVFSKIRARTGGSIRFAVSGGAPLSGHLLEFFWSIGIPIIEGYGLTETSPVIAFNRFGEVKPGCVGRPLYETWKGRPFVKIAGDGEILCQGPNVMKGYWNNPQATEEAIDRDGYFHTGDIGMQDEKGRLSITDRKKELIVTSGGKKIAPQPIENELKTDKYIAQAVLIGDSRNFITALIVPNFASLERWAGYKKLNYTSHSELVQLPMVQAKMMSRIEKVNQTLSNYERIKKIALLDQELTFENGTLTPSLKVKRRVVNQMFDGLIDSLYEQHTGETEAH